MHEQAAPHFAHIIPSGAGSIPDLIDQLHR
jgi:hypothetical protein